MNYDRKMKKLKELSSMNDNVGKRSKKPRKFYKILRNGAPQESRRFKVCHLEQLAGLLSLLKLSIASVDALETTHGWTIVSASGASLTMTYKRTLQLVFTPSSFMPASVSSSQPSKPENSSISLTYIADAHEYRPQALTTEKRFFLQIMRAQLQCLRQSHTKVKDLLGLVSGNWEKACGIAEEVRILEKRYITEPIIQSDDVLAVRSVLLLRDMKTKIDVGVEVTVQSQESTVEIDVAVRTSVKVVYGENLKEKRMEEFLEQRIGRESDVGVWARAVEELEKKLIARGRK